ncbi:MAG TPA: hypothetical protein VFW23_17145 [Tepidisphaeraceae bacterium]|nr:hypothetical protein [Tepidisphaeraceae bacterium]
MMAASPEFEELRLAIERLRKLLDALTVRGLRACGPDELLQLKSIAEYLEQAGAGHVASILSDLHGKIQTDDRTSPKTLLRAQTAVLLLERLLTLRIASGRYEFALAAMGLGGSDEASDLPSDDETDQEE